MYHAENFGFKFSRVRRHLKASFISLLFHMEGLNEMLSELKVTENRTELRKLLGNVRTRSSALNILLSNAGLSLSVKCSDRLTTMSNLVQRY